MAPGSPSVSSQTVQIITRTSTVSIPRGFCLSSGVAGAELVDAGFIGEPDPGSTEAGASTRVPEPPSAISQLDSLVLGSGDVAEEEVPILNAAGSWPFPRRVFLRASRTWLVDLGSTWSMGEA